MCAFSETWFFLVWVVLLLWSNDATVSVPDLAERLFARTADSGWVVVFKAMIVTHELMAKGSEVRNKQFCRACTPCSCLRCSSSRFGVGTFVPPLPSPCSGSSNIWLQELHHSSCQTTWTKAQCKVREEEQFVLVRTFFLAMHLARRRIQISWHRRGCRMIMYSSIMYCTC